jgi:hypothetical protein
MQMPQLNSFNMKTLTGFELGSEKHMAIRSTQRKRQAGQSVIIAIAVLFILAFLAAIFVALLARNLERTTRASDTLTADFYAQAGIQYADQMLTSSPQGADWRPPLVYQLSAANAASLTTDELTAYNAYVNTGPPGTQPPFAPPYLLPVLLNDPDAFWLNQGFTRYNTQGGRFLLRVSYGAEPGAGAAANGSVFDNLSTTDSTQSISKYIRIESIGRTGVVINNDPTTFTPQPIRLHAELVAYKPIGLVDYSRFITNKYDRADTANLGVPSTYGEFDTADNSIMTPGVYDFDLGNATNQVPQYPLVTVYGNVAGPAALSGGSLRCNTNLRLYGFNTAFLNGVNGDDWEIAGNLSFDGYNAGAAGASVTNLYPNQTVGPYTNNPSVLTVSGTNTAGAAEAGYLATPTNITSLGGQFDTADGLIRDAGTANDLNGFPRSIKRLNPPSLDVIDPSSGLNRYQELTQTGTLASTGTPSYAAGPYTAETNTSPATVYIDNISDVQQESSNVQTGGYTLRNDWLNPPSATSAGSLNWEGPFYNPPGATIVFGPITVNVGTGGNVTQQPFWGFTVTRTDAPVGLPSGSPVTWQWKNGAGQTVQQTTPAPTIEFAYGTAPPTFQFDQSNPVYFLGADNTEPGGTAAYNSSGKYDNDIVIYAEGNVRVRGVVSPTSTADPLTGGNYESSGNAPPPHHVTIVSGQIAYIEGSVLKGGVGYSPSTNYASSSSIAILAESYVCLNTTQFLAGASLRSDISAESADASAGTIDFNGNTLTEAFDLPSEPFAGQMLYLSQTASGGDGAAAYGEISFNQQTYDGIPANDNTDIVYDGAPNAPGNVNPAPATNATEYLQGAAGAYNRTMMPLNLGAAFAGPAFTAPGTGFSHMALTFGWSPESTATYQLERAAVIPSDVRIEAVLYAQDNSFFLIPGPWFNDDATDTMDQYVSKGYARSRPDETQGPTAPQPGFTDEHFPFFGQPIDMQITVDGSVIENMPADPADQTAWMLKWGWIPKDQGAELGAPTLNAAQPTAHATISTLSTLQPNALTGMPAVVQTSLPAIGLNIAYDPTAGTAANTDYDRLDEYGRPLPYTPVLPVSPDVLYSGSTPGNSLVQ